MKKITLILITLFAFIYANAQDYTVPRALPYKDTRWVENTGVAGASYLFDSIVMFRNIADTQMKPLYPAMGYLQNFGGDSTFWIWDMVRWKKLAGSGGGTTERFGIEDNSGIQDRHMNMQGYDFLIDSIGSFDFVSGDPTFTGQTAEIYLDNAAPQLYSQSDHNHYSQVVTSVGGVDITSTKDGGTTIADVIIYPDSLHLSSVNGSTSTIISITPTTAQMDLNNAGYQYLPLSVNGHFANSAGAITIPIGGSGTVTSFSAGNLSPLFTSSVATSTTTPALTFSLTNAAAHTFFGNFTGSTAAPSFGSPTLASADFANQGTTTTVLHGNASGNPSWASVSLSADVTGTLPFGNGGTGQTSYTDGQLLIGNTSTGGLSKSTLTAGSNITITNGSGTITIAASAGTPSLTSTQIAFGDGSNLMTSSANLTYASSAETINNSNIGVSTANGLVITNTQAATNVLDQWSPRINLHGSAWKSNATAASQTFDWYIEGKNSTGASTIGSLLSFDFSNNGGTKTTGMSLETDQNVTTVTLNVPTVNATTSVITPSFPNNASAFWTWGSSMKLFQYSGATNLGGNLQIARNNGLVADQGYALDAYGEGAFNGGVTLRAPAAASFTLSTSGTAGSTTITYTVVARFLNGSTVNCGTQTIATANATLTSSNKVIITLSANVIGAAFYDLYRVSTNGTSPSAGQVGKILSVAAASGLQDGGTSTGTGDGTTAPAGNNTGGLKMAGTLIQSATITAGGTTGAQTINKGAGCVNFAATATSLVVTNNFVATTSLVHAWVQTNDATLFSCQTVPAAGSFTIYGNAAATAETKVCFEVINTY